MSHTKGPWELDYTRTCAVIYDEGQEIIIADCDQNRLPQEVNDANARLVVAAPDLLAACKAVAGVFQDAEDMPLYARKCIAAIARVEGKP